MSDQLGSRWSLGRLALVIIACILLFDLIVAASKFLSSTSATIVNVTASQVGNETMIYTSFSEWGIAVLSWLVKVLSSPMGIAVLLFIGFVIVALEMRW